MVMMMMMTTTLTVNPGVLCSGTSVQREPDRRQRCDVEDGGENMSSFSPGFEDVGLREEKALSDSEVKVSKTCRGILLLSCHHGNKKNKCLEPFDFAQIKGNHIM